MKFWEYSRENTAQDDNSETKTNIENASLFVSTQPKEDEYTARSQLVEMSLSSDIARDFSELNVEEPASDWRPSLLDERDQSLPTSEHPGTEPNRTGISSLVVGSDAGGDKLFVYKTYKAKPGHIMLLSNPIIAISIWDPAIEVWKAYQGPDLRLSLGKKLIRLERVQKIRHRSDGGLFDKKNACLSLASLEWKLSRKEKVAAHFAKLEDTTSRPRRVMSMIRPCFYFNVQTSGTLKKAENDPEVLQDGEFEEAFLKLASVKRDLLSIINSGSPTSSWIRLECKGFRQENDQTVTTFFNENSRFEVIDLRPAGTDGLLPVALSTSAFDQAYIMTTKEALTYLGTEWKKPVMGSLDRIAGLGANTTTANIHPFPSAAHAEIAGIMTFDQRRHEPYTHSTIKIIPCVWIPGQNDWSQYSDKEPTLDIRLMVKKKRLSLVVLSAPVITPLNTTQGHVRLAVLEWTFSKLDRIEHRLIKDFGTNHESTIFKPIFFFKVPGPGQLKRVDNSLGNICEQGINDAVTALLKIHNNIRFAGNLLKESSVWIRLQGLQYCIGNSKVFSILSNPKAAFTCVTKEALPSYPDTPDVVHQKDNTDEETHQTQHEQPTPSEPQMSHDVLDNPDRVNNILGWRDTQRRAPLNSLLPVNTYPAGPSWRNTVPHDQVAPSQPTQYELMDDSEDSTIPRSEGIDVSEDEEEVLNHLADIQREIELLRQRRALKEKLAKIKARKSVASRRDGVTTGCSKVKY